MQEAVHRVRRRHVDADLAPHALLRGRQRERQRGEQPPRQRAGWIHGEAGLSPLPLPADGEPQLQQQELVVDQPTARRRVVRLALREVAGPERDAQDLEMVARPQRVRERILEPVDIGVDQPLHQAPHRARGEPAGEAVDRHQPSGVERLVAGLAGAVAALVLDDLEVLDLHLQRARAIALGLAVHDEALAAPEEPLEVALPEPHAGEEPGAVAQQHRQRRPRAAPRRRADRADDPAHGGHLLGLEAPERSEVAAVLVARGQVVERVLDGPEAQVAEELGPLRPDALHELQRRRERMGRRRGRARPRGLTRGQRFASCQGPCYKETLRPANHTLSRGSAWLSVVMSAGRVRLSVTVSVTLTT